MRVNVIKALDTQKENVKVTLLTTRTEGPCSRLLTYPLKAKLAICLLKDAKHRSLTISFISTHRHMQDVQALK